MPRCTAWMPEGGYDRSAGGESCGTSERVVLPAAPILPAYARRVSRGRCIGMESTQVRRPAAIESSARPTPRSPTPDAVRRDMMAVSRSRWVCRERVSRVVARHPQRERWHLPSVVSPASTSASCATSTARWWTGDRVSALERLRSPAPSLRGRHHVLLAYRHAVVNAGPWGAWSASKNEDAVNRRCSDHQSRHRCAAVLDATTATGASPGAAPHHRPDSAIRCRWSGTSQRLPAARRPHDDEERSMTSEVTARVLSASRMFDPPATPASSQL
jgi:hypothetical protein